MLHVHFWNSTETKQIKTIINKIVEFLIKKIGDDLVTVYLAGTILTIERKPESDIDLFCIVSTDFDFNKEDALNLYFKKHKNDFCGGRDTEVHSITISELEGGKPKSRLTKAWVYSVPIEVVVKQYTKYKRIWGGKIDFSKFPTHGIKLEEELRYWLKFAEYNLYSIKRKRFKKDFMVFIKSILRLSNIDAQLNYGYKFDPSFRRLAKHLEKEEKHIIHQCLEYREKTKSLTQKEKDYFLAEAENYVRDLRKKVKKAE